jgi:hypothetical protein
MRATSDRDPTAHSECRRVTPVNDRGDSTARLEPHARCDAEYRRYEAVQLCATPLLINDGMLLRQ